MTGDLVVRARERLWADDIIGELADHVKTLEREKKDMVIHFEGLVARIKKLEAALEPFAKWADAYEPDEGDGHLEAWDHAPTIGMLRAARNVLGELK